MPNEFDDVGFAAGVIRGARTFSVDGEGWLTGLHYKQRWLNGENEATCRKHERPYTTIYHPQGAYWTKPEPDKPLGPHSIADCKHGFYGYHDGSNNYKSTGNVYGVIEGYGITVFGTKGFRSMKARIVALSIASYVPAETANLIRFNYWSIPFYPSFDEMVELWPPDKGAA